jgi:hypothetical protein
MGHDEYVKNRISGLPSVSQWEVPEEERADTGGSGQSDEGTTTTSESSGPGEDGDGQSKSGTTGQGSTAGTGTATSAGATASGASGTTDTGGVTSESGSSGLGANTSSGDVGTGAGNVGASGFPNESVSTSSTSNRSSATGVGTARGPKTSPDPGDNESDPSTPGAEVDRSEVSPETSSGWDSSSLADLFRRWLRQLLGWPMIIYSNAVYLIGITLYVAANVAGIERFAQQLRSAGTAPDAVQVSFETRHGIESVPTYVLSDLSSQTPGGSILLIAGAACLPTVYFFLVRWTRKGDRTWQPTYLYVVGAAAPATGLLAIVLARPPGLYVDVSLLVVVPVVTLVTGVVVLGAGLLVLLPLFNLVWAANVYDAATKWLL